MELLASKSLFQLAHVDCLDQIQAHFGQIHVQTCYPQCLLTMPFPCQFPMMELVAPRDGFCSPL
jgi:hypothetical protein